MKCDPKEALLKQLTPNSLRDNLRFFTSIIHLHPSRNQVQVLGTCLYGLSAVFEVVRLAVLFEGSPGILKVERAPKNERSNLSDGQRSFRLVLLPLFSPNITSIPGLVEEALKLQTILPPQELCWPTPTPLSSSCPAFFRAGSMRSFPLFPGVLS